MSNDNNNNVIKVKIRERPHHPPLPRFPAHPLLRRFGNFSHDDVFNFNDKHHVRWVEKFNEFPNGKPKWQLNVELILGMIREHDKIRLYELDLKIAKERNAELREKWNEMRDELMINSNKLPGYRSDKDKIQVHAFKTLDDPFVPLKSKL